MSFASGFPEEEQLFVVVRAHCSLSAEHASEKACGFCTCPWNTILSLFGHKPNLQTKYEDEANPTSTILK
ncbi:hypothetical protein AV530_002864 [Patagioenas fasciata monilis]|uniref:Uncharacterized protein n=1 Tax=Patagioenas fasciata monilis TaxID=372326 RepID=A0A1V4K9L1_PATFA|nr:hypothetical protein AV530_002864 [Patagioenas fasciata monilis]